MRKRIAVLLICLSVTLMTTGTVSGAEPAGTGPAPEPPAVDLDLSVLSGTVVYAQVYNMMYEPDPYLGKIIRMAGYYNCFNDTEHGIVYHACIIPDATACCAQGIEFVRSGDYSWPEDYPEAGTGIVVTGRLEIYEEDGRQYLHLVDSEMEPEAGDQT